MRPQGSAFQDLDQEGLVLELLAKHGVHEAGHDRWRSGCPWCSSANTEIFFVFRNGSFKCFRCNEHGNVVKLVRKLTGMSGEAARTIALHAPRVVKRIERLSKKAGGLGYETFGEALIAPFKRSCPVYLVRRGFKVDTLKAYDVGYDHHSARIVLPARDYAGRIVGLTYRKDFDDGYGSKYFHENWKAHDHLYGFHLWAGKEIDTLFLVEGQLDAQRLYQLGVPACAVMGSRLYDKQVDLLCSHSRAEKLVVCFDNDEAGFSAKENTLKALRKTLLAKRLHVAFYEGKDPGELNDLSTIDVRPWYAVTFAHNQGARGAAPGKV